MQGTDHVLGDFFRNMSDTVYRTDRISTVEHASKKNEAITRIARLILPFCPDEGIRCISRPIRSPTRHNGAYDNCNEKICYDEERSKSANRRQDGLAKHHNETAAEGNDQITDKDMPSLWIEIGVRDSVCFNNHTANY